MTKEEFKITASYIAINVIYGEYSIEDANQHISDLQLSYNAEQYFRKEIDRIFPYHYNKREKEKRHQRELDEKWKLHKQDLYELLCQTYKLALETGCDRIYIEELPF